MTIRFSRMIILLSAVCLTVTALSSCGPSRTLKPTPTNSPAPTASPTPVPTPTPTPRPVVTINGIFPGEAPAGLADIFTAANAKMEKDIATRVELTWLPEENFGEGVTAAFTAEQAPDFFWCESSELSGYTGKGMLASLDELIAEYGQNIYKSIDKKLFDTAKINGKLMGVPSAGNTPLVNADRAFVYREDLRIKYSLPEPDSLANIELYLKTINDKESGLTPLCSLDAALAVMPALGTDSILAGTNGSVAISVDSGNTMKCMPVQDAVSFKNAVTKVREWYRAGWFPKDAAISVENPEGKMASGGAAATFGGALSVATVQAGLSSAVPGAALSCTRVSGEGTKYIEGDGGSMLCLAAASRYPERVVQFWDWILASQANYDLINYGIEGANYSLQGDRIIFQSDSYKGFPSWIFTNANYLRFPAGTPDSFVETFKNWNDGAELSPLMGFQFDGKKVKAELEKAKAVYSACGKLLFTGSSDTVALLDEFSKRIKSAGQDKIVAEAQAQVDAFISK